MLNTGLLTKLGFNPVVMYFYEELRYSVRQRKGWKRAPLFDFITSTDYFHASSSYGSSFGD